MVNLLKNKKSATVIELIIIISLIAIISATVIGVVIYFVQLFIYSPRQLDTQKMAQELTRTMVEGSQDIRGIRYTRSVIDASDTQFSYTYGYPAPDDELSVRFRWDGTDKHIYRSTSTDGGSSWSTETTIPYHISSSTIIDGKDTPSVIFTYKKANDLDWVFGVDGLDTIRRLAISINIKTGTGSFNDLQGSSNITSSVEIKGF
ncbi:MAG: LppP/LprE family lipoprotein [Candidatus Omnitrophica bacterium]|nr:LppP/LprE family lipoprotein [Candidatus Omnitrophota bacterium]